MEAEAPFVTAPIRIANCSGFYGDRLSAAREMVDGGPIDVLTGDWLAELTMLILARNQQRDPATGYARTFVSQMEDVMGTCLERGIRVVANAGGLNAAGCAAAVATVAERFGLSPRIAWVEGDDLLPRLDELRALGHGLESVETGEPLADRTVLSASAYLGGWGVVEALAHGADIVVTGRVTDAALVAAPAAWHHRWARDDWDRLAGAIVAGHVLECGTQTTGGNYPFFTEVPGLEHPGFPIAEIAADGSAVITKHPRHGGLVSVGTVTAQLLYEIAGPRYYNPDVTARFDTISIEQTGVDRVRISGVRGEVPPATLRACLSYDQGMHRTTLTMFLCGLAIEEKAALFERALWASVPGGRASFSEVDVQLLRTDRPDPATNEQAWAQLRVTVGDFDETKVGRNFVARVTELGLGNYPGFLPGPATTRAYGGSWTTTIPRDLVHQDVVLDGKRITVLPDPLPDEPAAVEPELHLPPPPPRGATRRLPLGAVAGTRSGDKGGNATLGVWGRDEEAYAWLAEFLTIERLRTLVSEAAGLDIERTEFPNLWALSFVLVGFLGEGVAASTRLDAQAKTLGEYVRAKLVDIPVALLSDAESVRR